MITSLAGLKAIFASFGVQTLYIKHLSTKQDNDKNQIYLGAGLSGVTNLFPARIRSRSPSASMHKRKSESGRAKLEAKIDLAWITPASTAAPAPNARIIDYFQYPEVRLSGFLKGCERPPDALRRVNQAGYGRRIQRVSGLFLCARLTHRPPDAANSRAVSMRRLT